MEICINRKCHWELDRFDGVCNDRSGNVVGGRMRKTLHVAVNTLDERKSRVDEIGSLGTIKSTRISALILDVLSSVYQRK
jgi:hypothetical protein